MIMNLEFNHWKGLSWLGRLYTKMLVYVKTKEIEAFFGVLGAEEAWVHSMSTLPCREKKI
jgi:hypothetical protein